MELKTTELTLGEAILSKRIANGDIEALPEFLRSRVADEGFDPLILPMSEVTKLIEQISVSSWARRNVDDVSKVPEAERNARSWRV